MCKRHEQGFHRAGVANSRGINTETLSTAAHPQSGNQGGRDMFLSLIKLATRVGCVTTSLRRVWAERTLRTTGGADISSVPAGNSVAPLSRVPTVIALAQGTCPHGVAAGCSLRPLCPHRSSHACSALSSSPATWGRGTAQPSPRAPEGLPRAGMSQNVSAAQPRSRVTQHPHSPCTRPAAHAPSLTS